MQTKKIIATLTQTRDRTPLASVCNMPRDEAEFTPSELRALAKTLCEIADASEALPMDTKRFMPRQREYSLIA